MSRYDGVYDTESHEPPAPVALVSVARPGSDAKIEHVMMIIDSGADVTVLPAAFEQLGLGDGERELTVEDFGGGTRSLPVVDAVLEIGGLRFVGDYLFDKTRDVGVLGRNILNRLVVELHGPALACIMRR